ncbi:MAG: bifunctional 5,10-methylenetetrahydrofolate dehydrogenase/5,10-methenyltetrahydrofolate cyclohydrolase [Patescibacteria group bacterium]
MVIDGRAIASEILASVRESLPRPGIVRAVVVSPTPATESYLSIKSARAEEAGMRLQVVRLEETATEDDIARAIEKPGADSVIVQLPLPAHLDTKRVLDRIPWHQDADVLGANAYARFSLDEPEALLPPVVASVKEILERAHMFPGGRSVAVVGQGRLVGEPVTKWLMNEGAEVMVVTRESGEEGLALLKEASIIVSGAGSPGLIRPEHLPEDVVLIDAGTTESSGVIVGDADPACAQIASVFTPVPGGVGPVSVACLFRNVSLLMARTLQDG